MSVDVSLDGSWIVFDLLASVYRMPVTGDGRESHSGQRHRSELPPTRLSRWPIDRFYLRSRRTEQPVGDGRGRPKPTSDFTRSGRMPCRTGLGCGWGLDLRTAAGVMPPWQWRLCGHLEVRVGWHAAGGGGWEGRAGRGLALGIPRRQVALLPLRGMSAVSRGAQRPVARVHADQASRPAHQGARGRDAGGVVHVSVEPRVERRRDRAVHLARRKMVGVRTPIADGTVSFKGHRYGPRTALWLRDLQTGSERVLMDPIESDLTHGLPYAMHLLPTPGWVRDSQSIVLSQGGRIRRVRISDGQVSTIPFSALVHRTISEMAHTPQRIGDDPQQVRFPRWSALSPRGDRVAFEAVGKIWLIERKSGTTKRLTDGTSDVLELSPAWSPDGNWIAFSTWDDEARGHLWKAPAAGGAPVCLTESAGEYVHPVWSPDGRELVVSSGSGATLRGETWASNPWYALVRVGANGGDVTPLGAHATNRSVRLCGCRSSQTASSISIRCPQRERCRS